MLALMDSVMRDLVLIALLLTLPSHLCADPHFPVFVCFGGESSLISPLHFRSLLGLFCLRITIVGRVLPESSGSGLIDEEPWSNPFRLAG